MLTYVQEEPSHELEHTQNLKDELRTMTNMLQVILDEKHEASQ